MIPLKNFCMRRGRPPLARALGAERHGIGRAPRGEGRPGHGRQGPVGTDAVGRDAAVATKKYGFGGARYV
jgi:hypothetical protein